MGRVENSNKIHFPTWSGEGDGCGLWSPRRGIGETKQQKTERGGQEMYSNIYRRKSYPSDRLLVL